MEWYALLIKPPLTPPDQVFMIVWPILYMLIGISFLIFFESKRKPEKINRHYYLCHSNGTEFTLVSRFFRPEISRSFSGGTLFAVILFGANFSDFLHQLQNGIFFITSLRNLDSFCFIPEYRHCRFKLEKRAELTSPFPHSRFIL